ncbi:hypothetical protein KR009_007912 [Drosophila setifemur]|nr:hypothetical protein KR009_007912 [Drosophila setifemur]
MGNVMDRKVSCAEARTTSATSSTTSDPVPLQEITVENVTEQPQQQEIVPNLTFHLFSYRQQMGCKKHQLMKWATSKLLLTEELLKLQKPHQSTSSSWINYESATLTDEEDGENQVPAHDDPMAQELCKLRNYRLELRGTILDVAQEKMKKREKKKLKRLKRRTLISSKKPSNKDKCKHWQIPQDEQRNYQDQTEVIVID